MASSADPTAPAASAQPAPDQATAGDRSQPAASSATDGQPVGKPGSKKSQAKPAASKEKQEKEANFTKHECLLLAKAKADFNRDEQDWGTRYRNAKDAKKAEMMIQWIKDPVNERGDPSFLRTAKAVQQKWKNQIRDYKAISYQLTRSGAPDVDTWFNWDLLERKEWAGLDGKGKQKPVNQLFHDKELYLAMEQACEGDHSIMAVRLLSAGVEELEDTNPPSDGAEEDTEDNAETELFESASCMPPDDPLSPSDEEDANEQSATSPAKTSAPNLAAATTTEADRVSNQSVYRYKELSKMIPDSLGTLLIKAQLNFFIRLC
ncbi:hypothetical protein WJX74_002149 [Apatococcus lobatus]|uniref:Uncharacterized protein n=1 Tax=Apatococcus lobatus TaxID=904363 RepID=A0AAW1QHM1_9CHLO